MANNFYGAIALTGGGAGALDAIDGNVLADGDGALVIDATNDKSYFYTLNASSGAAESSPNIIAPDSNAGNKRWILVNVYGYDGSAGHYLSNKANKTAAPVANDLVMEDASGNLLVTGKTAASVPEVDEAIEYTATHNFNKTTLTDGATINWDLSANQICKVTLGGNRTMAAPTNQVDGAMYTLFVIQDGTGSRTLTWNAAFVWENAITPTLASAAADVTIFQFISDGTNMFGSRVWKES
jgi:hypothetical protein